MLFNFMTFLLQILNVFHSYRGSFSSLLLRWKSALHIHLQIRHKTLMTLESYMIIMHLKLCVHLNVCLCLCVAATHAVSFSVWPMYVFVWFLRMEGAASVCVCVVSVFDCVLSWFQLYRSCTLTLSYRADGVRVLGSKTLLCSLTVSNSPPSTPLISSPAELPVCNL